MATWGNGAPGNDSPFSPQVAAQARREVWSARAGQGRERQNDDVGVLGMRGGRLTTQKARNPARFLTTPLTQTPAGHIRVGVPRAP